MRETCTCSLSGGRWSASWDAPPPARHSARGEAAHRGKRRRRSRRWARDTSPTLRRRNRMSTQLEQIAAKAKADRTLRFTSLAHLLTPAFLVETWRQMNRRGASGVDGETTREF